MERCCVQGRRRGRGGREGKSSQQRKVRRCLNPGSDQYPGELSLGAINPRELCGSIWPSAPKTHRTVPHVPPPPPRPSACMAHLQCPVCNPAPSPPSPPAGPSPWCLSWHVEQAEPAFLPPPPHPLASLQCPVRPLLYPPSPNTCSAQSLVSLLACQAG